MRVLGQTKGTRLKRSDNSCVFFHKSGLRRHSHTVNNTNHWCNKRGYQIATKAQLLIWLRQHSASTQLDSWALLYLHVLMIYSLSYLWEQLPRQIRDVIKIKYQQLYLHFYTNFRTNLFTSYFIVKRYTICGNKVIPITVSTIKTGRSKPSTIALRFIP